MNKAEKAAVGDHRTIETAATEVKANHMTSVLVTFNAISGAAISVHPFLFPSCNLRISKRISANIDVHVKAFFELQQGRALIIMAECGCIEEKQLVEAFGVAHGHNFIFREMTPWS